MNQQQMMQLVQGLLAKDPQAIEQFKQLAPELQQQILQMLQEMQQQQGQQMPAGQEQSPMMPMAMKKGGVMTRRSKC